MAVRYPSSLGTFICLLCHIGRQCSAIYTIDVEGLSLPQRFPASVLIGLINRHASKPAMLGLINPNDALWLTTAQQDGGLPTNDTVQALSSLADLTAIALSQGAVKAAVLYSAAELWTLPNVATLAGIHRALPLPVVTEAAEESPVGDSAVPEDLPVAFDARGVWQDAVEATQWALGSLHPLCNSTASLVALQEPHLLEAGFLGDMVAARQLFAFHLPDMCTAKSPSSALFNSIADSARAHGSILSVIGYFPQQEVVALCSEHHTEVSLVADFCSSLSFWSLVPTSTAPLQQSPQPPAQPYDRHKTYIAIIASDGDNMQMMFNIRRQAMQRRVELCSQPGSPCPPMTWTISNRLAEFAPLLLHWYFRQAAETGKDGFLLGPSGYGFLHPSLISQDDALLGDFVNRTEAAADLLATSAYVHWDDYDNACSDDTASNKTSASSAPHKAWFHRGSRPASSRGPLQECREYGCLNNSTRSASGGGNAGGCGSLHEADMERYLRRLDGTNIAAVFSPIMPFVPRRIGGLATFRELYRWFSKETGASLAHRLGRYRRGTIGYVYMIPGVSMDSMEDLSQHLPDHVQLVGYRELTDLSNTAASEVGLNED